MLFEKILLEVQQIEKATGTKFEFKQTNSTPPAPTDVRVRRVIDERPNSSDSRPGSCLAAPATTRRRWRI